MMFTLLIKMFSCSCVLMGYYWLFLRNKKFHHYNRFYLLGITTLSIVLPLIRIPVLVEHTRESTEFATAPIEVIAASRWENDLLFAADHSSRLSWENAMMLLYGIMVFLLSVFFIKSVTYIRKLSRRYSFERINSLRVFNTSEPGTPFSFFRSIFWNNKLDIKSNHGQQIFRHELFHVKQQHSADIIFLEVVCIVFWINPIFHLIKKEIKAIHEFLADQHAIGQDNRTDYAEMLVVQSLLAKKSSLSNHFFQNHIKRRIAMITQFKSKKYSYWTRLMVLPLSICLFCVIALYAKTPEKPRTATVDKPAPAANLAPLTVLVDAGHGGQDDGAKTTSGLTEKELCLAIARELKQQASGYDLKIIMTREDDVYPSLRDRTRLAANQKADLLVSIHVGSSNDVEKNSGFDIFVTNRNQRTLPKSKLLGADIANELKSLYAVGPIKQRKESGIWVLDSSSCPAVLIECGYLTNEKDLAFISSAENQKKIARQILEGISRYQARGLAMQRDHGMDFVMVPDTTKPDETKEELRRKEEQLKRMEAKVMELEAKQKALEQKHREMEIENKKMAEARMAGLELQHKALAQRQQDVEARNKQMAQARMAELEGKQRALAKRQKDQELQREKMLKQKDIDGDLKEKKLHQRKQRMESDQKMDSDKNAEVFAKALDQHEREQFAVQQKRAKERFEALQMEQKTLSQHRREAEMLHRKMQLDQKNDFQLRDKALRQQREDLEIENRKILELKRKEFELRNQARQQYEESIMNEKRQEAKAKELFLKDQQNLKKELQQPQQDSLRNQR